MSKAPIYEAYRYPGETGLWRRSPEWAGVTGPAAVPLLSRFAARAGLVILRQTFVLRSQFRRMALTGYSGFST
jgi:hypothetical protein